MSATPRTDAILRAAIVKLTAHDGTRYYAEEDFLRAVRLSKDLERLLQRAVLELRKGGHAGVAYEIDSEYERVPVARERVGSCKEKAKG